MSEAVNRSLDDAIKERKKTEGPSRKQGGKNLATKRTGNRRTGRTPKGKNAGGDKNKAQRVQRKTFKKPAAASGRFIRRTRAGGKADERPQKRQQPRDRKKIETAAAPRVEKRRLRVSNLDFNITHKDLMDLFSKFGSLTKNKIEYDDLGRSKGNAIIEYEKEDSANRAIEEYDGATLDGKTLSVEIDRPVAKKVPSVKKKVISKRDVPAKQGGQGRDRRREGGRDNRRGGDRRDDRRDDRRGGDRRDNRRNDRNRSESNRGGNKGNRQGENERRGGDNNRRGRDNNRRRGGDNKGRDNNRRGGEKRNDNNNNNNRFRNRNRSDNKKNLGGQKSS